MKKILIAVMLISALLLAACSSGANNSTTAPEETAAQTAAAEEAVSEEVPETTEEAVTEEPSKEESEESPTEEETEEASSEEPSSAEEPSAEELLAEVSEDDGLVDFLTMFDFAYFNWDADPTDAREYDCKATADGDYYIISRIVGHPSCALWNLYPVAPLNSFWEDDPSGSFFSYNMASEESVSWIAKNIFHVDDAAIKESQKYGPADIKEDFYKYYSMYYMDGNYYLGIGGIGGIAIEIDFIDARKEGDLYYLTYDYYAGGPDEVDRSEVTPERFYVVMDKAEIDGAEYWTLYSHSIHGFIEP